MTLSRALPVSLLILTALAGCRGADQRPLDVGGLERSYLLHLPAERPTWPPPLVLALHGRLGTGAALRRSSGLDALADRDRAIVAYPDGVDRAWADGRGTSPASQQGVDDLAFLLAVIEDVATEIAVDRERIYVVGISNGGFMAQTLACAAGERLAAVASVIATLPQPIASACATGSPLSVLFMNGTEDPLVPFAGGAMEAGAGGEILSSDASAAHWVARNRCASAPQTATLDQVDDGTRVHVTSHRGCEGGSAVDYYVVEGGGHTWPGGSQYLPEGFIGRTSRELDGMAAVWEFLLAQRRGPARE